MTYLNGGYSIIKKGDTNIYTSLENALTNGKPILFYEDDNTCYYIDSIAKSGDDIVLNKGGKTITITSANAVTESGSIKPKLYKYRFNVSDMYVSFVSTKLYKFETNKEYTINSDDYTTCILTGDDLQSLKDLLTDLPNYTCSLVADNDTRLNASENISVELSGTNQYKISYITATDTLTTDSTGYDDNIYLNIYEI